VIVGANLTDPSLSRHPLSITEQELVDIANNVRPVAAAPISQLPYVVGQARTESNPIGPGSASVLVVAARTGNHWCAGFYPYGTCQPISTRDSVVALADAAGTPLLGDLTLGYTRNNVTTVRAEYTDGTHTTVRTIGAQARLGRRFFVLDRTTDLRRLVAIDGHGSTVGQLTLPNVEEPGSVDTATTAPSTTAPPTPTTSVPNDISRDWLLHRSGAGAVRAGMTLDEANRASSLPVSLDETSLIGPGSACGYAIVDGGPTGLRFNVELSGGVWRIQDAESSSSDIATAEGVTVGDPVQRVRDTYGPQVREVTNPYDAAAPYLDVDTDGPGGVLMRFHTQAGRVVMIATGSESAVSAIEGCS
jgi:hypothetical protein